MTDIKSMNVSDLIKKLLRLPGDMTVYVEFFNKNFKLTDICIEHNSRGENFEQSAILVCGKEANRFSYDEVAFRYYNDGDNDD